MIKYYVVFCGVPVLIIVGLGMAPSLVLSDWGWLSRSGSLLTTFGVLLAYLDLSGELERLWPQIFEKIKIGVGDEAKQLPDRALRRYARVFAKAFIGSMRQVEIYSIVIGTIIWGYGDLVELLIPLASK